MMDDGFCNVYERIIYLYGIKSIKNIQPQAIRKARTH